VAQLVYKVLWKFLPEHFSIRARKTPKRLTEDYTFGNNFVKSANLGISIALPINGNIKRDEILTVWYEGGEFGEWGLVIDRLWPYYPRDTVALPSVFELKVGMNILFFAYHRPDNIELLLYVSIPSEYCLTNIKM
jgi:hypothetical protein